LKRRGLLVVKCGEGKKGFHLRRAMRHPVGKQKQRETKKSFCLVPTGQNVSRMKASSAAALRPVIKSWT